MPGWVDAILRNKMLGLAARVLATYAFWKSGIEFLLGFPDAPVGAMNASGLSPPLAFAVATIFTQLVGSALVIHGRWAWLGAGALGVFSVIAAVIAHPYWTYSGMEALQQGRIFQDKMTIIGGLFLAAYQAHRERV